MSNVVATETKRDLREFSLLVCFLLILTVGGVGLSGCSGVVSGNSGPNSSPTPSGDTTAPTVSITSPAAGATVSGTVNLTANATDNVAVASVQFKVDGTNAGPSLTATPYAYSLNTGSLSNASHSITAVATDTSGNSTTSAAITVQVNNSTPDTTPPTVAITSPANGATVSGTVNVTANATDNVSVASVQFQLDGADVGSLDTASPYTFSWNTATVSNGSHSLRAIAKDGAGNTTTSASVTVTVSNTTPDTTPPTVSITAPSNGATVSGTVSVTATASDNVGVASVQFQLDGANVGALDTTSPYAYSWNTTTASNGSHTLRAIAKDAAGNSTTSASVTVTVSNVADTTAPSVPAGLTATAVSSSQINLSWTASTDNVGVTGYKVYRGGTQIGTSPSTSYQDAGLTASTSYSYKVAAYDAAGNTSAQSASATATTQAASSGGGGIPTTLGWYQISNTQGPTCPSGFSNCQAVVSAWSGGVADTARNRLIVWGGGHTDYDGNEVYALNLTANPISFARINDPSTPIGSCSAANSDGTANARHSYDSITYMANLDRMFVHGGSLACGVGSSAMDAWTFNFANMTWQRMDPVNGTQLQNSGLGETSDYDPNTGTVIVGDNTYIYRYDYSTNTYTRLGNLDPTDYHLTGVVDPKRKLYFIIGNGRGLKADINSSHTYSSSSVAMTNCGAMKSNAYPGLAYDPVEDRIVGWAGGDTIYLYNPDTDSCTSVTYSGGPGAAQANGTFGRFRYFPALGVFALVNSWSQNAYILRLTASSGTSGTSAPVISNIGVSSITQTSGTVTWTTDVAATTQVEYGTTTAYGSLTALNSTLTTSHSQALTGLTAGTLYHYRVHSKNSSGIESISGDAAFSTNSTSDATPPTVSITSPANGATVSGTVSVTANASDNVGVASVQFLLDGANLGALDVTSPYQIGWDTTTASNGTHTLSAIAADAAGNTGNAVSVSVTVSNSGSTSSALQDFQSRCSTSGVIVCEGFDSASEFVPATYPYTGLYSNSGPTNIHIVQDTTVYSSGGGALHFPIPAFGLNTITDNNWFQSFCSAHPPNGCSPIGFGQNSTFYVQFRYRVDSGYLQDWEACCGSSPKIADFAALGSSCGSTEITTNNRNGSGMPMIYKDCGSNGLFDQPGTTTYTGDGSNNSNPPYLWQSGYYGCAYPESSANSGGCYKIPANTWLTFYYKVQIGTWNNPNSHVTAWVAPDGQPLHTFVDTNNLQIDSDQPAFNAIYFNVYMTGYTNNNSQPANVWLDEVIVSTNPIPAPAVNGGGIPTP